MSVDTVVAAFRKQHAHGKFPGGQLSVRRGGSLLIDEAIGIASGLRSGEPQIPVTAATRFQVFSCSKPFVAYAVALLEARGLLDVNAPLSQYVPEWPSRCTVLDVLTHRSGILLPEWVADETRWSDAPGLIRAIAQTPARYPQGTLAYAPYEFGWILGEIVARVAGESLPAFIKRELPRIDVSFTTDTSEGISQSYWVGGKRVVAGVELSQRWEEVQNNAVTRAILVPGAGMIATASALSLFYETLLSAPEVQNYVALNAAGFDRSNNIPLRVGRGFLLGNPFPSLYGWFGTGRCFGHAGAFCSVAGADPDSGVSFAYVTNANTGPYELLSRAANLIGPARRC